jgi:PKD repeat protein
MTKSHRWRVLKRDTYLKVLIAVLLLLCVAFPVQAADADFTGSPTSGKVPLFVTFNDLSLGNITSWLWNFGDGSGSDTQNATAVYLYPGSFDVSLTVTDNESATDTETKQDYIKVNDSFNLTAFDVNQSSPILTVNQFLGVTNPTTGTFTAKFTVFADGVTEDTMYQWNFGPGSATTNDPVAAYDYLPGIYQPNVTVTGTTIGDYTVVLPMDLVVIDGSQTQYQQFMGQYWLGFFEEV